MIERIISLNSEQKFALGLVGVIDLLVLYLALYFFKEALTGRGFNIKTWEDGHWGKITEKTKATNREKRDIWVITLSLILFFLFNTYVILNDSKLNLW